MNPEAQLKENFMNMKTEFQICHHKICRKIDAIFVSETNHFKDLLINFNNEYKCIDQEQINLVSEEIQKIFNSCKVILVHDYSSRFNKNVDLLTITMYDFFIKKLSNPDVKSPVKVVNRYLMEICRFDGFLVEDSIENKLIDFSEDFIYRYINCEDARRDFDHIVKNVHYSLSCELKKAINNSIEDKQDITARYNSLNKELVNKKTSSR